MRKITEESINAFNLSQPFKKQNMEVKIVATESGEPCIVQLLLHDNMIAEKHTNKRGEKLYITNAGWKSNTTKERLNAIEGVNIYQKNWQWYLNNQPWDGSLTEIK